MMTTLAALMGALPIALGFGADGSSRRPLGLVVVGGLIVSQFITLVHHAGHLPLPRGVPGEGAGPVLVLPLNAQAGAGSRTGAGAAGRTRGLIMTAKSKCILFVMHRRSLWTGRLHGRAKLPAAERRCSRRLSRGCAGCIRQRLRSIAATAEHAASRSAILGRREVVECFPGSDAARPDSHRAEEQLRRPHCRDARFAGAGAAWNHPRGSASFALGRRQHYQPAESCHRSNSFV